MTKPEEQKPIPVLEPGKPPEEPAFEPVTLPEREYETLVLSEPEPVEDIVPGEKHKRKKIYKLCLVYFCEIL